MTKPLFYLKSKTIYQRPVETSRTEENGVTKTTTSLGFPICTISQYVTGEDVCSIFNEHVEYAKRIEKALTELRSQIDGGEECRGRDSAISAVIGVLEGSQYE